MRKPEEARASHTSLPALRGTRPGFLNLERAGAIGRQVLDNRDRWCSYGSSPLVALGVPAYRFQGDRSEYRLRVGPINRWLIRTFSGLYKDLLSLLSVMLGETVTLLYEVSYPGFHVLGFEAMSDYDPGNPHCDMPHFRVPWIEPGAISVGDNLTFVLPLVLPSVPCGLEIFDARAGEIDEAHADWEAWPRGRLDYCVGMLYLFSGNYYHRISPTRGAPDEHRITLQGHIARVGDRLVAYW